MEHDFWLERWRQHQIGFHLDAVNEYLVRYIGRLGLAPGARVFAPLCGKSLDMGWLHRQGYGVVGIELSPLAVADFFKENRLEPERRASGPYTCWHSGDMQILCGDFFALDRATLGRVDAVYDRAALIALPAELRGRYATHMAGLLPAGTKVLLITLSYPQEQMSGPPFSVNEEEVTRLYVDAFVIEKLESTDALAANPRFRERGLSQMMESVYLLTRR